MSKKHLLVEGKVHENVLLESFLGEASSKPGIRAVADFPRDIVIHFPTKLLAAFPPGTYFRAAVQVCQEHWPQTGKVKGPPYLVASNIYVHRLQPTSAGRDGRAHEHVWEKVA